MIQIAETAFDNDQVSLTETKRNVRNRLLLRGSRDCQVARESAQRTQDNAHDHPDNGAGEKQSSQHSRTMDGVWLSLRSHWLRTKVEFNPTHATKTERASSGLRVMGYVDNLTGRKTAN